MSDPDIRKLMPHNWDNHAQWDVYYEACRQNNFHTDPTTLEMDLVGTRFVPYLTASGCRKIWVPGCGLSIVPSLLAAFGFEVWASDISNVAVLGQEEMQRTGFPSLDYVNQVKNRFKPTELPADGNASGTVYIIQHDFRTDFSESDFDCILNIKAFQGLPLATMFQVAETHWHALAGGKHAIFDTVNVQGERRTQLEDCLLQAGFYIPGYAVERWYRQVLDETEIPYIFVLGLPFPQRDKVRYQGADGQQKWEADRQRLLTFGEEHRRRLMQDAAENERILTDAHTKIADIVYSTG